MNSNPKLSVLIVDDEGELRRSVIAILKSSVPEVSFEVQEVDNGQAAIDQVKSRSWDFVLMDVRMPGLDGLEALKEIKEHDPQVFVVIMTAHSNLNDAVIAIKNGAYDYVEKPVKPELLSQIVRKALEARELISRLALSNPIFDDDIESDFVGQTEKMREVFQLIYRLCKVDTTVLIRGDNGTGKELVARAIHYNSPRKSGNFVAVNCGAIPENLMESEFFGHEKGAFTGASERKIGKFQTANNGTLFLDEVGELKPEMQVKLLRVLQERKFTPIGSSREVKTSTRIIAATNRNLEKMMEQGLFREDLFYRLNVMPIFLPPLRERKEDIPALIQHFVKKFSKQHQNPILGVSPEAMELLQRYRWPGNIRELENAIERAFVVETTSQIRKTSLPETLRAPATSPSGTVPDGPTLDSDKSVFGYSGPLDFDAFKEGMEKEFIVSALKANKGRINQTVAQANIPKNTLLRKIRKFGIVVKDFTED